MSMISHNIGFSGEYKFVINKSDGITVETDWFSNIILNQGLDRMGLATGSIGSIIIYCQVGTGNSTPSVTQIGLDEPVAVSGMTATPNSLVNSGDPTYAANFTWAFTFTQGSVVGNITEVGVGWESTIGNSLFSRALILNNLGAPTSITLVSTDQLTVYYRLKVTPSVSDVTGSVTISGVPYNYTARIANAASFLNSAYAFWPEALSDVGPVSPSRYVTALTYGAGSVLGPITGVPTLPSGNNTGSRTMGEYIAGNFYRDDIISWSVGDGNATGGIQSIVFRYAAQESISFQYRFDTVIPKDNTKTLSLTSRIVWNRV